jgi:hypothetical protein
MTVSSFNEAAEPIVQPASPGEALPPVPAGLLPANFWPWRGRGSVGKSGAMSDFVDVPGASGAQYRFRRAVPAELPPTAGNLLVATGQTGRLMVLFCGAARSLSKAAPAAAEALKDNHNAHLYVRLNVARTTREAEHQDIVAATAPATVAELD